MSYTFNDLKTIRLAPMSSLLLLMDTSTGSAMSVEQILLAMPEQDSTWSLEAITRPDDEGGATTVAWRLQINATFAYTNLEDMRPALALLAGRRLLDVNLSLAALSGQAGAGALTISLDDTTVRVRSCSATWSVESADMRPRLRIQVKGVYSADAIEVSTHGLGFFTQGSGWS